MLCYESQSWVLMVCTTHTEPCVRRGGRNEWDSWPVSPKTHTSGGRLNVHSVPVWTISCPPGLWDIYLGQFPSNPLPSPKSLFLPTCHILRMGIRGHTICLSCDHKFIINAILKYEEFCIYQGWQLPAFFSTSYISSFHWRIPHQEELK